MKATTSQEKDDILAINQNRLDEDAAGQPKTLRQWADKLAFAEKRAKLAKRKLRITKAELSKSVRAAPSKYGVFKITDVSVEDAVVQLSSYRTEEEALIEAELSRDLIKNMVVSLHERGEQMGNLVKLHGQQYWARVKADPEEIRSLRNENQEETMKQAARAAMK